MSSLGGIEAIATATPATEQKHPIMADQQAQPDSARRKGTMDSTESYSRDMASINSNVNTVEEPAASPTTQSPASTAAQFARRRKLARELASQYFNQSEIPLDAGLALSDPMISPSIVDHVQLAVPAVNNNAPSPVSSNGNITTDDSAAFQNGGTSQDPTSGASSWPETHSASLDKEMTLDESTALEDPDFPPHAASITHSEPPQDDSAAVSPKVLVRDSSGSDTAQDEKSGNASSVVGHEQGQRLDASDSNPYGPADTILFSNEAAADSKFTLYHVAVNPLQDDRAVDIPLYSAARPHMRAFHLAWIAFFVAFFTWFAMTPLLGEIERSLDLSRKEIWTSSVLAVSSSAVTRMLMGPLNDKYGARWVMSVTLVAAGIPTALAGLVNTATGLYVVRLLIGVAGSAFVTCQYWTSCMFTVEVAGTANALSAGWGNMAGGVAQVLMGTLLFPLFKIIFGGEGYSRVQVEGDDDGDMPESENDRASDLAWRVILVFPALMCFVTAWAVVRFADDTPKGNVNRREDDPGYSTATSFRNGLRNRNTWLLSFHYACSFGVEITMIQAAALYFQEEFGQSTESAAAIASIFGWMNLFARGIGGFCSDMSNAKAGLRGRLIVQAVTLFFEGGLVIIFSFTKSLGGAIVVMAVFSIFVQAAEGSTFGIVPYVDSNATGTIAGLVGAGGNIGGIGFALLFRGLDDRKAFLWMGCTVLGSALWTALIYIPGHRSLFAGRDSNVIAENRLRAALPVIVSFPSQPADHEDELNTL